mmetsp:Transcript_52540/g.119666  ORF Transcript_52540/g.119666 Transcript_52540/m.119666 type:complete len:1004 (-) Transcript_52540:1740-4751(-)
MAEASPAAPARDKKELLRILTELANRTELLESGWHSRKAYRTCELSIAQEHVEELKAELYRHREAMGLLVDSTQTAEQWCCEAQNKAESQGQELLQWQAEVAEAKSASEVKAASIRSLESELEASASIGNQTAASREGCVFEHTEATLARRLRSELHQQRISTDREMQSFRRTCRSEQAELLGILREARSDLLSEASHYAAAARNARSAEMAECAELSRVRNELLQAQEDRRQTGSAVDGGSITFNVRSSRALPTALEEQLRAELDRITELERDARSEVATLAQLLEEHQGRDLNVTFASRSFAALGSDQADYRMFGDPLPVTVVTAPPGQFAASYEPNPARVHAFLCPGDEELFLGGGALNGAVGRLLLENAGQPIAFRRADGQYLQRVDPTTQRSVPWFEMEDCWYRQLHRRLFAAARKSAGDVVLERPADGPVQLSLCRVYSDGRFPFGAAFVNIFRPTARPFVNERNAALVYTVGALGINQRAEGEERPSAEREALVCKVPEVFVSELWKTGLNIGLCILEYNQKFAGQENLPAIQVFRFPIVAGGTFINPQVTPTEAALALIWGFHTAFSGASSAAPRLEAMPGAPMEEAVQFYQRGLGPEDWPTALFSEVVREMGLLLRAADPTKGYLAMSRMASLSNLINAEATTARDALEVAAEAEATAQLQWESATHWQARHQELEAMHHSRAVHAAAGVQDSPNTTHAAPSSESEMFKTELTERNVEFQALLEDNARLQQRCSEIENAHATQEHLDWKQRESALLQEVEAAETESGSLRAELGSSVARQPNIEADNRHLRDELRDQVAAADEAVAKHVDNLLEAVKNPATALPQYRQQAVRLSLASPFLSVSSERAAQVASLSAVAEELKATCDRQQAEFSQVTVELQNQQGPDQEDFALLQAQARAAGREARALGRALAAAEEKLAALRDTESQRSALPDSEPSPSPAAASAASEELVAEQGHRAKAERDLQDTRRLAGVLQRDLDDAQSRLGEVNEWRQRR